MIDRKLEIKKDGPFVLLLKLKLEQLKFKRSIHNLSKKEVWSTDYIFYLLKKLSDEENKSISWVRETVDSAGNVTNRDIFTCNKNTMREISKLAEQEKQLNNASESDIIGALYKGLILRNGE